MATAIAKTLMAVHLYLALKCSTINTFLETSHEQRPACLWAIYTNTSHELTAWSMSPPTPKTPSRRISTLFVVAAAVLSICRNPPRHRQDTRLLKEIIAGTHKKLVGGPGQLNANQEYDYIIVGGGTAGCVLAARLTENPDLKVLVLEAGASGKSVPLTRIPVGFSMLFGSKHVYNFYTEPQTHAESKTKFWPRAKLLGGCSSINAQMAQYGAPGDFDEWAAITKDDAWNWKNFRRYFSKFESFSPDANPIITPSVPGATKAGIDGLKMQDYGGEAKNKDGPIRVGYHSYVTAGGRAFVEACVNEGIEYSPDFNGTEGTRGVNRVMTYIDEKRTRVSSETGYLTDEVLARPNLTVVLYSTVTKVITEKEADGQIRATGVEIGDTRKTRSEQKGRKGKRWSVNTRREVIVAAGAIHSPHILLLSGIGSSSVLSSVTPAIPTVHELPGVGKNLVDHPVVDVYYKNAKNDSPTYLKPKGPIDLFKLGKAAVKYLRTGEGPLGSNVGEVAAFVRSDDPKLFPEATATDNMGAATSPALKDSTSAADSPDLELFLTPFAYKDHARYMFPMDTYGIHVCLLRPLSKGTLTLKTGNPFDAPAMDPNYLSAPEDVAKLIRGIRLVLKIGQAAPLDQVLDHNNTHPLLDHQLHHKTDAELEALVRDRVETLYHPAGTCRMAPLDQNGVVDSHLRVHGVNGLRVCDASIFPEIVSGHTAGACLAMGEHLADIIKAELATPKS